MKVSDEWLTTAADRDVPGMRAVQDSFLRALARELLTARARLRAADELAEAAREHWHAPDDLYEMSDVPDRCPTEERFLKSELAISSALDRYRKAGE